MRVLFVAVGSRGDAEPFCSLAASLAESAEIDTIDIFVQMDLIHLVPIIPKVRFHKLPFTQMDFYKYAGARKPPQAGAGHGNPRVNFLGIVTDIMGELVLPCLADVLSVAMPTPATATETATSCVDAIVASSLARQLALELAGQLQLTRTKPPAVYLVQLQPLVPTKNFPHFSQHDECLKALVNANSKAAPDTTTDYVESYLELERFQFDFLLVHIDKLLSIDDKALVVWDGYRKPEHPLEFAKDMVPALMGYETSNNIDIWMVNAVSTHLIAAPSDAGPKVLNVGSLADSYIPAGFEPPVDLVTFLDTIKQTTVAVPTDKRKAADDRPACFGYGSMPFDKAELVVEALYEANCPAILVGSAMMSVLDTIQLDKNHAKLSLTAWAKNNIHCVAGIPYAWLLPRCSMMFSHGGAGVVHATLRAGIPSVISPLMGDQFMFADYLQAKGWGVRASSSLGGLTKNDVLQSIGKARDCQEACRVLGDRMAKGEPVGSNSGKFGPDILTEAIVSNAAS
ncbi:hypothetical protein SARC_12359 [Sphaeroforma arctica JP610]|uniref:Erythromycin biosynthesis protein CIII-like C-terminal domain-containing protein n=1 Tax=Sphaeroforma arctica JP610 TaxID=667725 RepID=A0A0L0FF83_9EUKA|nr:hypothetical protein SARC_12359 [Sphaeroforma arctica JP610]KNC75111.1 hypothetical protein SARC_12359 [Sphaeroforma arctica JP610]|eukprot:XP_014149013.1 hypothetical protein SARC_12359 [Sphaeroforma arctica JP610]